MNKKNLQTAFELRKNIKDLVKALNKKFEDYAPWLNAIEFGNEILFELYLDAPTEDNMRAMAEYWFATEPFIAKLIKNQLRDAAQTG